MASKTSLNAKNLEALGAERLARLLIEISTGNAVAKRRLRLALSGAQSPKLIAREIAKQITRVARARTWVTWENRKPLVDDLEALRRSILEQIVPADADEALHLLWRFMALAAPVFDRSDDSSGIISGIFDGVLRDIGEVAGKANVAPKALAEMVFEALKDNEWCQYFGLISIMSPTLGSAGLAHLKALVEELGRSRVPVPPKEEWKKVGAGLNAVRYEHEERERRNQYIAREALKDIADAQGDADAYVAQLDPKSFSIPKVAAEVARRLLAAGRAQEALDSIDGAEISEGRSVPREWQDARLEALEALGRPKDAQTFRWACFERDLSSDHLRDYLKRLPDFEDVEAEERAMAHVATFPTFFAALMFFIDWPALDRAATLLIVRQDEIDGNLYRYLLPAAEALSERHPLAATLALRAMVDFTLTNARSTRYGHAADHLSTCARLASEIRDFGKFERHAAYIARLKEQHGKKASFWSLALG